MRYFVYISDTKVNMLLPQVPGVLKKKIAAKFGFDIKILDGEITTERSTLDTRIDRLVTVENYINTTQHVGTLDNPQYWISGEADAKIVTLEENTNIVLFIIETSQTIMVLGGSSRHLISEKVGERVKSGYSFTPFLLREFERKVLKCPKFLILPQNSKVLSERIQPGGVTQWAKLVHDTARKAGGVSFRQSISFLGKRLLEEEYQDKKIILGSPLCVSLAK